MRPREEDLLIVAVNARYTDHLPATIAFPYDFIRALCQVALDQEKRIKDLEERVNGR